MARRFAVLFLFLPGLFLAACQEPSPTAALPAATIPLPPTPLITPGSPTPGPASSELAVGLDDYLQRLSFNGSVLVARDDGFYFSRGYGLATLDGEVANTPQTQFLIGSLTKQFTAAAILKLQEEDRLQLEDPLSLYLPDYPGGDSISLHQLLTHSAGVPDYTERPDLVEVVQTPIALDALIATFAGQPADFSPGERFRYSNSGYILLTHVVEAASGRPYGHYLAEAVLQPAGMLASGYDYTADQPPLLADGYDVRGGAWQLAPVADSSWPAGAGAMYSTVEDIYHWHQALNGSAVLNESSRQAMFSNTVPAGPGEAYGYGWFIDGDGAYHGGSIFGFVSFFRRYTAPDGSQAVVIVLSNVVEGSARPVAEGLLRLIE